MQDQITSSSVSVNGYDMTYVEQGTGTPVVFVHGTVFDHRSWDPHRPAIAQNYRAIVPDLRYCGTGEWPDDGGNWSIQTHADDLAALIHSLAEDPVTLVGWSYGSVISFVAAVQNPGLVGAMFHYEPSLATFLTDPEDVRTATEDRTAMFRDGMALAEQGDLDAAVRAFVGGANSEPGFFDRMPPAFKTMILQNARTLPLIAASPPPPSVTADDLRALDIPVKIVVGGETRAFFKIVARTAVDLLPSAEFEAVDGGTHTWPALEPDAFNRILLDFLAQH